jgi:hypothetical protein
VASRCLAWSEPSSSIGPTSQVSPECGPLLGESGVRVGGVDQLVDQDGADLDGVAGSS